MYEPCILKKGLQYSCDMCGELPIVRKRWCCNVCEDFGEISFLAKNTHYFFSPTFFRDSSNYPIYVMHEVTFLLRARGSCWRHSKRAQWQNNFYQA